MSEQKAKKVLLVGDTTLNPLGRLLERSSDAPRFETSAAPYGQVFQILLDENHSAWSTQPEILVVWTAAQLTIPSFARLLNFEFESPSEAYEAALRETEQLASAILRAASRVGLVLVPTWILPEQKRWIQSLSWRHRVGVSNFLAKAALMLAEKFAHQKNIILLDAGFWQVGLSGSAFDPRMYAVAKILYSQKLFERAAAEIRAVVRGTLGLAKKVVVCDLDNTLWGGVVGDDGPQNLKLGAPDPLGECFQALQKSLKSLSSRGVLLAISSKNEEKLALSVIDEHPAMILRRSDFAAWRINWNNKAENIQSLAQELNLGLDSFVFLDDSPQERDHVRQLLPQVLTPDLPSSPSEYAVFLESLSCFETPTLEKEDIERAKMYQVERSRQEALDLSGDIENWLGSLQISVNAAPLRLESLPRAAQLLNKTNQFNLSLRRLDEKTFWDWAEEPHNSIYTFNVSDRFGDFGLVGLASFTLDGSNARIADFVMSCRVMGKKIEEALLGYTIARAQAAGADQIYAPAEDGPRNGPAKSFFTAKYKSAEEKSIDLENIAVPAHITLHEEK